jgi:hypothetical protein
MSMPRADSGMVWESFEPGGDTTGSPAILGYLRKTGRLTLY